MNRKIHYDDQRLVDAYKYCIGSSPQQKQCRVSYTGPFSAETIRRYFGEQSEEIAESLWEIRKTFFSFGDLFETGDIDEIIQRMRAEFRSRYPVVSPELVELLSESFAHRWANMTCKSPLQRVTKDQLENPNLLEAYLLWKGYRKRKSLWRNRYRRVSLLPNRLPVYRRFGSEARQILDVLAKLETDFFATNAPYEVSDTAEMIRKARVDFREKYPVAPLDLVDEIALEFARSWR